MASHIITPNSFSGSDSERINQAVQAAAKAGRHAFIPRLNEAKNGARECWLLDEAILLPSNITLELDNCHLKLSDKCRDNFIRSANCGLGIADIKPLDNIHIIGNGRVLLEGADHPRATGDSAKTIGERTYGTDAGKPGVSQKGDWRNIGILFAYVNNFSIQNIFMKDSHCWAISLERCGNGLLRNLGFDSTGSKLIDGASQAILNQDGLDLRQGCHDIIIENVCGRTGDDLIALTGIPHPNEVSGNESCTMVSAKNAPEGYCDDIYNVIMRNIKGHCAGGHHIVRLLNTSGIAMHDIIIDSLLDTSSNQPCFAALKIGDNNPAWGGVTPLGQTSRIFASKIISHARNGVLIAGSLCDSAINGVIQQGGSAITKQSGEEYVKNVKIEDVVVC